jgi:signal transduction histidine kinase
VPRQAHRGGGEHPLLDELAVHHFELEIQNEELRAARLELEHAAARQADLYEFAPISYVSLDERGGRSVCELALDLEDRGRVPARLIATIMPRPRPELLLALEDVSEQARSRELSELYSKLVEADRRKDEFLGMLSHELRNPLAPIRNSTYILQHAEPGSEQALRAQAVIQRQTEHLMRLVDDLLDVTRIARGKVDLQRSRVDLREVVWRAADDFRLLMDERGVAFRISVPETKIWADADVTRVTQVIGNLLQNAATFTHRDEEVVLSLRAEGGSAEIAVRDTGAGIDAALLPTVFDAFVQGERTLARTDGGLGLGLALVKGIVELHGGTVHAESAGKGLGAEFVVRLPLAEPAVAPSDAGAMKQPRTGRRRVLVVEDNHDAAQSLAEALKMLGHGVEVAYDGPTAIEKARVNPPDVVLCDIGLPGMSGYEVARALRVSARDRVQIIAVSGYAQPEDVKRAIEAGFDGHVAKPCDPEKIERLLA